jgi:hypothetical protein
MAALFMHEQPIWLPQLPADVLAGSCWLFSVEMVQPECEVCDACASMAIIADAGLMPGLGTRQDTYLWESLSTRQYMRPGTTVGIARHCHTMGPK